jgi:deoxyribodipyrimidine photolyase-related protein
VSEKLSARSLRTQVKGKARTLAVVFGDQLDRSSPALQALDRKSDAVLMMEVAEKATHVPSHRQRTVLFLAAMRRFALDLLRRGYRVRYVKLDSAGNTQSFDGELQRAVRSLAPERIVVVQPGEWRVSQLVEAWQRELPLTVDVLVDTHFTSDLDDFAAWAAVRKQLVMEHFYREQRRRLGVLVDDRGKPTTGRWNFDSDNRAVFKSAPDPPRRYTPRPDTVTAEVIRTVNRRLPDAPGRLDAFEWPVKRAQAQRALSDFVANRLPLFGTYQDAMWFGQPWLYHSTISSSLNLKLLTVGECINAAVEAWHRKKAPLNAVEGFVRQLIGWREFIRGV